MTRLAIPVLRPVDGDGNPYPSGTITFYDAGASSVLKTVYSDSALSVSLGSTVTADGEGLFVDIYYSGDIRMVLANSAGTIQVVRDIYGAGNIDTGDIVDGAVITIKIDDAAVTLGKLLTLGDAKIITSNGAANSQVSVSGDVTMSNTGVFTLTNTASRIWKSSTVGGTAQAITAVSSPVITALVDGMIYILNPASSNTATNPTFAPDGLTARTIVSTTGTLKVGDIQAGKFAAMIYDLTNTRWILLNPAQLIIGEPAVQAYAKNSVLTFAHGLAAAPKFCQYYLVCTTGEHSYTAGEELTIAPSVYSPGSTEFGFSAKYNATNVILNIANDGIVIVDDNAATLGLVTLTDGSWNIGVRCFY